LKQTAAARCDHRRPPSGGFLTALGLLMRPQLNSGMLGGLNSVPDPNVSESQLQNEVNTAYRLAAFGLHVTWIMARSPTLFAEFDFGWESRLGNEQVGEAG
jgi:hypothetical protein